MLEARTMRRFEGLRGKAATNWICPECGSETTRGAECVRCHANLTRYSADKLGSAFSVQARSMRFTNERSFGEARPAQIQRYLESIVDLASVRSMIDVGCGPNILGAHFQKTYPEIECTGYDQYPYHPEIEPIDLDDLRLPHADGSVDLAVCSHVLEHVEGMHGVTRELIRVAKTVLILLPNSMLWTTLAKVALGRPILPMLGLPLEKPLDRHRWVYGVGEADRWASHVAGKYGRDLHVQHRVDFRVPTLAGQVAPNLFVVEMAYAFVSKDH